MLKKEQPFWFSSLDQKVQFDTLKFRRTFENYFGQFVWIEKKVTSIVAFNFMKRRLKTTQNHECKILESYGARLINKQEREKGHK